MYAYHEGSTYEETNLRFFMAHGLVPSADVMFIIVVNGDSCSLCAELERDHPSVLVLRRPNEGFDFGGYAAAVSELGAQ